MNACPPPRAPRRSTALAVAGVGAAAASVLAAGLLAALPAQAAPAAVTYSAPAAVTLSYPLGTSPLAGADGVAVSPDGSTAYVLDGAAGSDSRILTVTSAGAVTAVTTLTGVRGARGIALGGSTLYVADTDHHRVVSLPVPTTTATVTPTPVAGSSPTGGAPVPGAASGSPLKSPSGVAWDSSTTPGSLYIADTGNNQVEKVVGGTSAGTLTVVAGTGSATAGAQTPGVATSSRLNAPRDVAVDPFGALYIADTGNDSVAKVVRTTLSTAFAVNDPESLATDGTTVLAGGTATLVTAPAAGGAATAVTSGPTSVQGVAVATTGTAWLADDSGATSRVLTMAPAGADAAPQITSAAPTTAATGVALSRTFTASGFPRPTWSIVGTRPASVTGLDVGPASGVLTGTPTTAGPVTFTVRASNTYGGQEHHDDQQVTLQVGSVPAAVARPTAVAGQGSITLTWAAPAASTEAGGGVTGYVVTPYAAGTAGTAKTVPAGTLSTTLTGLRAGVAATFTVTATNAFGSAVPSAASAAVTPYGGIAEPPRGLTRYQGGNRVMTAVRTSQQLFPDAGSARAVVLASSTSFADSLAGARLASAVGAPLLLTDPGALNSEVAAEVTRVLAVPTTTTTATTTARATTARAADAVTTGTPTATGTVYLLGGTTAVSAAVETAVKAAGPRATVTRLSGADRYETAVRIAAQVALDAPVSGAPLYLASGRDFPDGLAVAALAARTGGPVLLTDGPAMPAATLAYLQTHDPNSELLVAVGGPAATATGGHGQDRAIVGADRYDTARLVAARFTAQPGAARVRAVGLATGQNWPDALAGAAAMGNLEGPLLLTPSSSLSPSAASGVAAASRAGKPSAALVFGGPSVVSAGTADALAALVGG